MILGTVFYRSFIVHMFPFFFLFIVLLLLIVVIRHFDSVESLAK